MALWPMAREAFSIVLRLLPCPARRLPVSRLSSGRSGRVFRSGAAPLLTVIRSESGKSNGWNSAGRWLKARQHSVVPKAVTI